MHLSGRHHHHGPAAEQPARIAEQAHFEAAANFGQVETVGAAAGPLAAQGEQRVSQRVSGGLSRAYVHQVQPARGGHDGVPLTVDLGELDQVGVARAGQAARPG